MPANGPVVACLFFVLVVRADAASFEKSFTKDMGLFFKEAPLSMKLEMAPMLEGMQGRMQGMRMR